MIEVNKINSNPSSDKQALLCIMILVKEGSIKFLYSAINDFRTCKILRILLETWDFNNPKQTKEVNLTHDLIAASKAGFAELVEIYDKDPITSF
ncbi:hypothetical protein ACT7DA_04080 [Bacillus pacificus]